MEDVCFTTLLPMMNRSSILSLRRTSKDFRWICDSYVESNVSGNYSTKKKYLLFYRRWNDLSDCTKLFFLKKVLTKLSYTVHTRCGNDHVTKREISSKHILEMLEEQDVCKLQKKYLKGKIVKNVYNDIANIQDENIIVNSLMVISNFSTDVVENLTLADFFYYYSRSGGNISVSFAVTMPMIVSFYFCY